MHAGCEIYGGVFLCALEKHFHVAANFVSCFRDIAGKKGNIHMTYFAWLPTL